MVDQVHNSVNHLQLDAVIEGIGSQRYTPAGILALDVFLKHQSVQNEAGEKKQVELSMKAVAFDELARKILGFELGVYHQFFGFLATRGHTQQLLFHITGVESI